MGPSSPPLLTGSSLYTYDVVSTFGVTRSSNYEDPWYRRGLDRLDQLAAELREEIQAWTRVVKRPPPAPLSLAAEPFVTPGLEPRRERRLRWYAWQQGQSRPRKPRRSRRIRLREATS